MQTKLSGVNGWTVVGADDLEALEKDPSLFVATKGNDKITLRNTTFAPGMKVTETLIMRAVMDWRLVLNGHDVSRGRDVESVLKKAVRLMEER